MQSRLRTCNLVQKNAVGFALSPTFRKGVGAPPIVRNIPLFPLGFLLVPCGGGQQKKVLILGQHLSVCIGKRVSYFTSSYIIGADQQRVGVSWYKYGTKTGDSVRFCRYNDLSKNWCKDTKNTNTIYRYPADYRWIMSRLQGGW